MPEQPGATSDPAPGPAGDGGAITLRLPYRPPLDAGHLFRFLAARAVPGVEAGDGRSFRRSLRLAHGAATVRLHAADDAAGGHVACTLRLDDRRDLAAAVAGVRRLLDLDADPGAVDAHLGGDAVLGPLVAARPGLRSPGSVDPAEMAVRAVLGQQVTVASARTAAGRLVAAYGEPLAAPEDGLTHLFPTSARLSEVDPARLPMPRARARGLVGLARALATGDLVLDPDADPDEAAARLSALPGVGPWTVGYVRLRGLGDPDVFLPSDLGARRALERLGASGADPVRWRPWRSYALHHLWSSLIAG